MFRFSTATLLLIFSLFGAGCLLEEKVRATSKASPGSGERSGTLVIVGGGGTPRDVVAQALDLAGGRSAHVVVIPFASSLDGTGSASARMWERAGARNVTVLTRKQDRSTALRKIHDADLIWFPGGGQNRLMNGLTRLALVDAIRERYRAGAVVGGTSAGAAVMSGVMLTGASDPDIACGTGLGLWPEVIVDMHYLTRHRRSRLLSAMRQHPNLVGVGIDEGTAVIVRDQGRELEVAGRSEVEVILPQPRGAGGTEKATYRLAAGEVFELPGREHRKTYTLSYRQ
jgi:cyanophycinase